MARRKKPRECEERSSDEAKRQKRRCLNMPTCRCRFLCRWWWGISNFRWQNFQKWVRADGPGSPGADCRGRPIWSGFLDQLFISHEATKNIRLVLLRKLKTMSYPHSLIVAVDEVQTLRQELADTRNRLQDYADTIVSLHGELRTLRQSICDPCKRKLVPSSSQATETAVDSSLIKRILPSQGPTERTKSSFSWRRLLKSSAPDRPPTSEKPKSTTGSTTGTTTNVTSTHIPHLLLQPTTQIHVNESSDPPTTSKTPIKTIVPETEPSVPRWSVDTTRDPTADHDDDATLAMKFVRAFIHKGEVRSVRFSADGKYIAAAKCDWRDMNTGTIIYNVETGDKICELVENASGYSSTSKPLINCVCFSPNGKFIVVGDTAHYVTVWDITKKRIRSKFKCYKSYVRSVDVSPNGRFVVSISGDGAIEIWNMRDGSARLLDDIPNGFWCVRFSSNGQYVAAGADGGALRIWNVPTGWLVKRWFGHGRTVQSLTFTPDGRGLVSSSRDGAVKCWDVSSILQSKGKPVATTILEGNRYSNEVDPIAVSSNGQCIASSLSNSRMIIWSAHSPLQCTLVGHEDKLSSVDFSPVGNYLALGSLDHCVSLWRYTELG